MTLGSHQSTIGKSQVHITPRFIVDATGPFDLDPCAADPRPWDCAAANITEAEDGLATAWQIANYFVCGRLCKCSCHYAAPAAGGTNPRPTSRRAVTAKANEDSPASAESVSGSAITAKGAAATEGPTAAPRGRGSSKTTAPESSGGSADVPSAAWLNQRTTAISRRGENTSPAGAGSALGSTRPTVCDSDVLIPEKQSGSETPTAATQDPIGVARPNESAPGWTTSGDVVIKSGSPSTGCRRIGHLVSDGGDIAAHIATRPGRSRKTTSFHSRRQSVPGQSPETLSQLALPAIPASEQETPSRGSRVRSGSTGSCPTCAALGCQWIENPKPRIWLNPPFHRYQVGTWIGRLAAHGRGTALLHARTETEWFKIIWRNASAILFLGQRLTFHKPDGSLQTTRKGEVANSGAPPVLCSFGFDDADVLAACGLDGAFVPLRLPRSVVIVALEPSWREAVEDVLARASGPVSLEELYRAFARHPKARGRRHWREKVRQTLRRGGFARVGRGVYAAEPSHAA